MTFITLTELKQTLLLMYFLNILNKLVNNVIIRTNIIEQLQLPLTCFVDSI